ncbi:MAG TPA: phosphonate ABC transporter, permease protein PhnE [Candidatus Saccharimonadales bacterium]|jgi:phosphonate transport system permease protein|nr:phosphonate ABC transporter, permease protein PhnE [Candidatus Saccharimonadales bacterium]
MAEYFTARGMPVPRELTRGPLSDWRRNVTVILTMAVLAIGFKILDIDLSRSNPNYMGQVLLQLVQFDWSVMTPQSEFETFWDTAGGLMIVTIFLGIMGTAFALVVALPLSFLGARNIMAGNPITNGIYVAVRLLFTIIRSIDVLIVCLIVLPLFGLGNASGVFALAFHNVGVMGKLYSEAIEGIDAGPAEAMTATGANRFQVIWAAIVPQLVNPFISFTIYRLDTNVRLANVIGLVGGGGIGVALFQNIQLLRYHTAGTFILLIVITVAAMDFISAQVRKRLV